VSDGGVPSHSASLRADVLIAVALTLVSGALYVATCAPSVLFGDGGEFQFVPYILGIAHPTGYPLYVLLGWAWSHLLPLGDVAYRMNLFSAVVAAPAVACTYLLARRVLQAAADLPLTAVRIAAVVAGLTFAVGATLWNQAVIAEVYALNALFVVLTLLLWLRFAEVPTGRGRGLVLAVTYGLSLAHHRTMLLLLPGIALHAWVVWRAQDRRLPCRRDFLVMLAGFAVPLALYLYLPLRAPQVPYASLHLSDHQTLVLYDNSLSGWVDHITAAVFTGNLRLSAAQAGPTTAWLERLAMVGELLRAQVGLLGVALAMLGLLRMTAGRAWAILALTVPAYAAGVVFNLTYAIGDVAVLFIPSYLFVSLWAGAGLAALAEAAAWVGRRIATRPGRLGTAVAAGGLLLPIALGVSHWPLVVQSDNRAAAEMWLPILERPVPQGAVLVTNDRDEMMPLWYFQYVEGRRTDLLGLFPRIVTNPAYADVGGIVDAALESGRPAFLVKPMPGLEVKVRLEEPPDVAPLVRLAGPAIDTPPEHPLEARLGDELMLIGYDLAPASPQPGEAVAIVLHWQPLSRLARDYTSFVHLVGGDGATLAQSDHRPGGDYYPTSLWKPGEMLRDVHTVVLPAAASWGGLRLRVGMYEYPSMESPGPAIEVDLH
jgi:hypothetical protein